MTRSPVAPDSVRVTSRTTRVARWLLGGYVLVVLALTLAPQGPVGGQRAARRALQPLVSALTGGSASISGAETEALLNVLLFLPFGLLLPLALPRLAPVLVLLGAAALSLGVETVQSRLLDSRVPALQDVLHNAGGTAIGLVLTLEAVRLTGRRRRWSGEAGAGSEPAG